MSEPTIADEPQYLTFLEDVKSRIQHTRIRVVKSANRELIELYWSLGQLIAEKQEALGWGKSVVEQLAADLRTCAWRIHSSRGDRSLEVPIAV